MPAPLPTTLRACDATRAGRRLTCQIPAGLLRISPFDAAVAHDGVARVLLDSRPEDHQAMPRVARQGVDKQVEQFGLRRDIEFGRAFAMKFGLCGDTELLGYESGAVPKQDQFDHLSLTAGQD